MISFNTKVVKGTSFMMQSALFSARKDVDGLIHYFKDEFVDLPVSREKTMLEGVFKEILGKATSEEQARGESYFMKK